MQIDLRQRHWSMRRFIAFGLAATATLALASGSITPSIAHAATADNWPLMVTQIVPNNKGTDNYEFTQVTNNTDKDISLTSGPYSLAYSSNTSVPASTRTDYPLTVSGTDTTVPAHGTLVLWNQYSGMPALTDADFRSFWQTQNPNAPTDYKLGIVTGTNGFSNSAARAIRVLGPDGKNVSYGFYDSGAYAENMATNFETPADSNNPQMDIYSTGVLAAPGVVDPLQLANHLSGENFVPVSSGSDDDLDGLVNTPRVSAMLDKMHFMGNFLLVKNGEPTLISKGYADASTKTLNDKNTLFATASLEKAMTATVIEQLISEGKISFDDKLSKFLPYYGLTMDGADTITVNMLLNHTSGIHMPEMPVFSVPGDKTSPQVVLKTQQEQVKNAVDTITISGQGSSSYSNGNYTMLAAIATAVTDTPFETLMEDRLFKPAGMTSTYFWDTIPADKQSLVAKEYAYQSGADYGTSGGPVATESLQSTLLGAGNIFTTIGDLYKFYKAMNGGAALTSAQYDQISTSTLQNGYAGGLYHYPGQIKRARGSASTDDAGGRYNSFVYGDEDNQNLVLILSNQSLISGNPAPMDSYDDFAENVYLELSQDPAITSVSKTAVTTENGKRPTLPSKVDVTFTSGATQAVTVNWDTIAASDLAKAGSFTVEGQLRGLKAKALATVKVKAAAQPAPKPKVNTKVAVSLSKGTQHYKKKHPAVIKIKATPKAVAGKATVYDKKKKLASVKVRAGKTAKYTFSKKLKRGTHKVHVVFQPANSTKYKSSTSKTVTLKVKR